MKKLMAAMAAFMIGAGGVDADQIRLANGGVVEAELKRVDTDGIVVVPTGKLAVKYFWNHLAAGEKERILKAYEAQKANEPKPDRLSFEQIVSAKEAQTAAFSLEGKVFQMSYSEGIVQEVAAGVFEVRFDHEVFAKVGYAQLGKMPSRGVLFVKMASPAKFMSEVAILGNFVENGVPVWR